MIKELTLQGEIDKSNTDILALCKINPKEGFYKANETLRKAESIEYVRGIGEALRNLAFSSQLLGLIPEGYDYANRAVEIFEQTKDKKNLAHVYHTLGFILDYLENQTKRLEINIKCLQLSRELNEEDWIIRTLNNTGDCYTKLKNYDEAITCFTECLNLLNKEDTFMYSVVTCNLGEVYFYGNNLTEAKKQFELSKNNAILNNSKGIEITNILFLSKCLEKEGQGNEAMYLLRSAIEQIEEIHKNAKEINFAENSSLSSPSLLQVSMDIEAEAYKTYAVLCESNGDLKHALEAFKKNKEIEEKLNKQKYTKEYESIELRIEISHLEKLVNERTGELEKTLSDLQVKEQNNRLVIENAVDSIVFFNWDGDIIDYNRKSLNFFDLEKSLKTANIKDLMMFTPPRDMDRFIAEIYSGEKNNYNTQRHKMKAVKSDLFFEVAFTKINTNGNSQGVAFISDITEKVKSEEQKTLDLKSQTIINKITRFIHDENDYFQILNKLGNLISEELQCMRCAIRVIDDETGKLIEVANLLNTDHFEDMMDKISDSEFMLYHHNWDGDHSQKAELRIPLKASDKNIGILIVEHYDASFFSDQNTKILTQVSSLLTNRLDKIQEQRQKELLQKQLYEINQKLEDEVHNKTKQLNELTHKYHEHEKESLLADLAGSISHELNTPFGIINSGANAIKEIVFEIIDLKLSSKLNESDISFALNFSKSNTIEKIHSGRAKRKSIMEFCMFLESKMIPQDKIQVLSEKFVEANFHMYKTQEIEYVLAHSYPEQLLSLITKIQQSISFSETISNTSSRAADVVKELTKVAKKNFDDTEGLVALKPTIESVISVYKYQLDDIEMTVEINDDTNINGSEITLFQLWKNLILFLSKNFASEQSDKFLTISGSDTLNEVKLQFVTNGLPINNEIIHEIDRIQSIEDKVNPKLNLKLGIIKKIVTDHKGRLNIESTDQTTIFSLFFPK